MFISYQNHIWTRSRILKSTRSQVPNSFFNGFNYNIVIHDSVSLLLSCECAISEIMNENRAVNTTKSRAEIDNDSLFKYDESTLFTTLHCIIIYIYKYKTVVVDTFKSQYSFFSQKKSLFTQQSRQMKYNSTRNQMIVSSFFLSRAFSRLVTG